MYEAENAFIDSLIADINHLKAENESLKNDDIQLLRTGMNDNVNLLNEDELGEIFGGYKCEGGYETTKCPNIYEW